MGIFKKLSIIISLASISPFLSTLLLNSLSATAQPVPANDGTRTVVVPNNNTFNITGGTLSGDRGNLFHSFNQFNLEQNQVANFISQPGINNILGRVVGSNPSLINGLIQVTNGNANLFLINPAGIVFGQNARLDVPSSFIATTAGAVGFGANRFTVAGNNDYANLNGNPSNFIFPAVGSLNGRSLVLSSDQSFPLIPEPVPNIFQGSITPTIVGRVDRVFRLSSPGNILSLEINSTAFCQQIGSCPNGVPPTNWSLPVVELPRLLTTLGVEIGTGNNRNVAPLSSGIGSGIRESGLGNLPFSATIAGNLINGGVLPLGNVGLVLENSALLGSDRQIVNFRQNQANLPSLPGSLMNSGIPNSGIGGVGNIPGGGLAGGIGGDGLPRSGIAGGEVRQISPGENALGNGAGIEPGTPLMRPGMIAGETGNGLGNMPRETGENGDPNSPAGMVPSIFPFAGAIPSSIGGASNNMFLAIAARESRLTGEFNNFLNRSLSSQNLNPLTPQRELNPLEIQEILADNQAQTNIKSGVVYLTFTSQVAGTKSANDVLEVVMLTPGGTALRQTITGATRSKVLATALNFRSKITSRTRSQSDFLPEAQQLYQWFIAPLEAQLKEAEINNLILITDGGLRSLPMAALHDGEKFLIDRYSITLVPTLSLTNLTYRDIRRSQILAMGASQFTDKDPLPAVPLELQGILGKIGGQYFLNESFTLDNLRRQRQEQPFQIIHLATHAVFAPGDQRNSYIQLWDSRLGIDQLRQLGWNDPPVDLLVLSACDTALGDEQAELGFAGLAIQAGVKSALASLWSVSDEGTLGLMREFYRQLEQAPIKAEALRRAQLAMLRGEVRIEEGKLLTSQGAIDLPPELAKLGNVNLSHPYFWSAFTLIGSPW
jgi:filamentous hemagglutinin family protein